MTETALQPALTVAEAFAEIARRRIGLTSAFDGRIWVASVEQVRSKKRFTKADMVVVSATGPTPIDAVKSLIEKLDDLAHPVALFEEAEPW